MAVVAAPSQPCRPTFRPCSQHLVRCSAAHSHTHDVCNSKGTAIPHLPFIQVPMTVAQGCLGLLTACRKQIQNKSLFQRGDMPSEQFTHRLLSGTCRGAFACGCHGAPDGCAWGCCRFLAHSSLDSREVCVLVAVTCASQQSGKHNCCATPLLSACRHDCAGCSAAPVLTALPLGCCTAAKTLTGIGAGRPRRSHARHCWQWGSRL